MTDTDTDTTIRVDQFVAATTETVWRTLTEPDLVARWWADGEIAATVTSSPSTCRVSADSHVAYWKPSRRPDSPTPSPRTGRSRGLCARGGPGCRGVVLPRLADLAPTVT